MADTGPPFGQPGQRQLVPHACPRVRWSAIARSWSRCSRSLCRDRSPGPSPTRHSSLSSARLQPFHHLPLPRAPVRPPLRPRSPPPFALTPPLSASIFHLLPFRQLFFLFFFF